MQITINKRLYKQCETASENYWANSKPGKYGKGLINTDKDPCKVTRIGLLGEAAFAQISNLEYDFEYKTGGDNYDFVFGNNQTIDVKTASRNYGMCMAIYESSYGKVVFQPRDYFVVGYIEKDDREKKSAIVEICGFFTLKNVFEMCRLKKSPRGNHRNYELAFSKCQPIEDLLEVIEQTQKGKQILS